MAGGIHAARGRSNCEQVNQTPQIEMGLLPPPDAGVLSPEFHDGTELPVLADRVGDLLEFLLHLGDRLPLGVAIDLLGPHAFLLGAVPPAGLFSMAW